MKSVEVNDHSLKTMAEKAGIEASEIQKELGIGRTTVYSILNGKYGGKPELIEAVQELIERRSEKKVEDFRSQSQALMDAMMGFTLRDKEFTAVSGASGIGKTTTALRFQAKHENVLYLKIIEGMNYGGILNMLLNKFGCSSNGNSSDKITRLLDAFKRSSCEMLIVDEADLLKSDNRKNNSFMKKFSIFREMHCAAEETKSIFLIGLPSIEDELRLASDTYLGNRVTNFFSLDTPEIEEYMEFWTKVLGMELTDDTKPLFTQVKGRGCFRILKNVAKKARLFDGNIEMGKQFLFI